MIAAAEAILTNNLQSFLTSLIQPQAQASDAQSDDAWPPVLATLIERLVQEPPRNWGEEQRENLIYAIKVRYSKLGTRIPPAIEAALFLMTLLDSSDGRLARLVQRTGPKGTASLDACKEMLAGAEARDISYPQIANALLFMVTSQSDEPYDAGIFVEGLRQHRAGPRIDWTDVVQGFDKDQVRITKPQFLAIYNALLPLAREYANFDIQNLWSGQWQYAETQLSFVVAFLSTTPQELDVSQIPNLRQAFTLADFEDASDSIRAFAAEAVNHPLVSRDATEALFTMIFRSQDTYNHAQMLGIPDLIINPNMTIFVCAASAVPKPWAPLQEQALKQLFYPFLCKNHDNYDFVMHSLWTHDKHWVAARMVEFYQQSPNLLIRIFEHAQEQGWLDLLLTIQSSFAVDLATYAHGKGHCNLEEWAQPHIATMGPAPFARAIQDFLGTKLDDEQAVQQEHMEPQTPPLTVKTVHLLLLMIGDALPDQDTGPCYRQCLQRYARLFNYGESEKINAILDSRGEQGNGLPEEAGSKMEEQYKDMYGGKTNPEQLVSELKRLKISEDPNDQDLFAAMLQGLFDEYNCFGEYPNEALATTAVLFGGLIQFHALSTVAEHAAIYMIFQAVGEYGPDDPMYRFGLQAMIHLTGRLEEWPHVAERILHTPSLRGTQVIGAAEEAMKKAQQDTTGLNGDALNGIANGVPDEDFLADTPTPLFTSINVDRVNNPQPYDDPDEEVSDKVMFVLNNVSKRNIDEKFKDLQEALERKHHHWFAHYLVEELAKTQANFQGLYLQLLENFGLKTLWAEVLRETYLSASKMLNAESTMNSAPERVNLKNLATWLGSLTLARNQPILHRNISFKDLLIEGHETQRLLVAIPFTCKTLVHAKQSKIFKPPNPWIMELLGVLSELYNCFELKLNLKFEIEMLCKDLGTNIKDIDPLDVIRSRPLIQQESMMQPYLPDSGQDGFADMHLMGLSKRPPNERFSPENVIQALPDLSGMLQIPQAAGNVTQPQLRTIFVSAAQQAIYEIIAPVVERSVTIAAISTSELIQKDFATEVDVDKLLSSAHTMVKKLSGCLALVTCKEPLRMSIMNNIRILAARSLPDQLPEGQIIMFVNDNIDTVCGLVEQQAAEHSMAEINAQLAQALEDRRRHAAERPNSPYNQPPVTRWSQLITPPFAQQANGLNAQQLSLYEDFGRQPRVAPSQHASEQSVDSTRQIAEVVQDNNYLPSLPTPAEAPVLPRQTPQQRHLQTMQQNQHQVNGYAETPQLGQQVGETLRDLQHASREASETHIGDILQDAPVRRIFTRLMALVGSAGMHKDDLCTSVGIQCLNAIVQEGIKRLEMEVFVGLMRHLYAVSPPTARVLSMQLAALDDQRLCNAPLVITLMQEKLVDKQYIDHAASRLVRQHQVSVLGFLEEFFDEVLVSEKVMAFHSDYVLIYDALRAWLEYGLESLNAPEDEEQDRDIVPPEVVERLQQLMSRLQKPPTQTNGLPSPPIDEKQDRLDYVFEEWITLQRKDTPIHCYTAFIKQVHEQHLLDHPEDNITFWRRGMEVSLAFFDKEANTPFATPDSPYIKIDALAKLMAYLVTCQSSDAGVSASSRAKSLDSIVRLVVLVMNDYQNKQRERFNARFYFRLFSTMICEVHALNRMHPQQEYELSRVFALALEAVQPRYFPTFLYSWLALISHRLFVPAFLAGHGRTNGGWQTYLKLLSLLMDNLGKMLATAEVSPVTQDFYRGVARIFMMLHHDFPEFLIENHLQLNTYIPVSCHQLHNVVNSAVTRAAMTSQPDPFQAGLIINRLEQVRQPPTVFPDLDKILDSFGIKDIMQSVCTGPTNELASDDVATVVSIIDRVEGPALRLLLNTIVLYVGTHATKTSSSFSSPAPPARLLDHLFGDIAGPARFHLATAMVNQLRYVNAHTHYFATALQHYFVVGNEETQQAILRVLVERLGVPRPHPWGVIVMTLELVKNAEKSVFDMGWVKAAPQVEQMLRSLVASQERMERASMAGL